MPKQNIYDNDTFFTDFKKIRRNRVNFNDLLETPVLMKMLPDLKGRSVLDIGCGMGQHAMQYATLGAERVLGIDISTKMLAYARENNSAECITYRNMAMEDLDQIEDRFDVVTSSLVFDYIEDFEDLMKKIHRLMNDDAVLVFSTSHPMATAYNGKYPRFTRNKSGERLYANICDYADEGRREIYWMVNGYELYHRTLSSMINGMISAGFRIEECHESAASPELLKEEPAMFGGTRHRPDFIFFRCSRA
ncbi:MAG: methyltransferase domain-containing protein [Butyrivibrio sp.]|jgi:ubiquinone/menaquinone biosynthesis C-methylase UbiE|nr:methyltransferase domain-containing protein [Butyrivibrio sp.]